MTELAEVTEETEQKTIKLNEALATRIQSYLNQLAIAHRTVIEITAKIEELKSLAAVVRVDGDDETIIHN